MLVAPEGHEKIYIYRYFYDVFPQISTFVNCCTLGCFSVIFYDNFFLVCDWKHLPHPQESIYGGGAEGR